MSHHQPRSVLALSGDPQRAELLDALLDHSNGPDVVFVDTIAHGYSRIKQLTPDLVVVLAGVGDAPACQLLSMLKMDRATSGIPVVTLMTRFEGIETELEEIIAEMCRDWSSRAVVIGMN